MREIGHYIGGKQVAGAGGRTADVFNPATGEVQAKVALASAGEVAAAVENAQAAQPAWGATNPQRRARVMMEFVRLLNRDMDKLAEALSREHGKTVPDARGDVQRGLEVAEFCIGAPHLLKGEFTDSAGPGIDMFSMRQPLGVVAGITPFNFPAMIPMWKFAPAISCGNAFILKPSERDPSVPMMLAGLMREAGLPDGVLNVVNGDKEAVDAILANPVIQGVGFVGSTPIAEYIYSRGCANGKRVQCFGGAKNHMIVMPDADMDQAADALVGAGYGAAGERCMAISVAVPVGDRTADALIEKLAPRIDKLKVGPYTAGDDVDYGPLVTKQARERVIGLVDSGVEQGATLVVDGRDFRCRAMKTAFSSARICSITSPPTWISTSRRFLGRSFRRCARIHTRKRSDMRWTMNTAMEPRSSPAMATPRAISPTGSISAWSASMCRSRFRSPITRSAAGRSRGSATSISTVRTLSASIPAPRP